MNFDEEYSLEVMAEATRITGHFIFKKKQKEFLQGLSRLAEMQSIWLSKFENNREYDEPTESFITGIKKLYKKIDYIGMDLNLLFFQADLYLLTSFIIAKYHDEIPLLDIQPARYFMQNIPKSVRQIYFFQSIKIKFLYFSKGN